MAEKEQKWEYLTLIIDGETVTTSEGQIIRLPLYQYLSEKEKEGWEVAVVDNATIVLKHPFLL